MSIALQLKWKNWALTPSKTSTVDGATQRRGLPFPGWRGRVRHFNAPAARPRQIGRLQRLGAQ